MSFLPRPCAEFPNDNPELHDGAVWVCSPGRAHPRAIVSARGMARVLSQSIPTPPEAESSRAVESQAVAEAEAEAAAEADAVAEAVAAAETDAVAEQAMPVVLAESREQRAPEPLFPPELDDSSSHGALLSTELVEAFAEPEGDDDVLGALDDIFDADDLSALPPSVEASLTVSTESLDEPAPWRHATLALEHLFASEQSSAQDALVVDADSSNPEDAPASDGVACVSSLRLAPPALPRARHEDVLGNLEIEVDDKSAPASEQAPNEPDGVAFVRSTRPLPPAERASTRHSTAFRVPRPDVVMAEVNESGEDADRESLEPLLLDLTPPPPGFAGWQELTDFLANFLLARGATRAAALLPALLDGQRVDLSRLPDPVRHKLIDAEIASACEEAYQATAQFRQQATAFQLDYMAGRVPTDALLTWLVALVRALLGSSAPPDALRVHLQQAGIDKYMSRAA